MDNVDKVQVVQADRTMSMDSGQSPWTLSSLLYFGHCPDCPLNPWTISTESMGNVQGFQGQCPGSPLIQWTDGYQVLVDVMYVIIDREMDVV